MKNLKKLIEGEIGFPISLLLQDRKVVPLYGNEDDSFMFGSEIARKEGAYLLQGELDSFLLEAQEGYFAFGHWGHGICSNGLYYQRVDEWSRIFFRLPYLNAFEDHQEAGRLIREFLLAYFDFERRIKDKVISLIATESMFDGLYRVIPKEGVPIEISESLYRHPDFIKVFHILIDEKEA